MKYEVYTEIKIADDYEVFEFLSVGKKGVIPKRIEFISTDLPNITNMAFGDIDENGEIDDYSISDNDDRNKILATIAYIVEIYLNMYPDKWVYFKGSTQEVTLTVDESLNKLKGKVLAPKKLAAANKSLKRLKNSLPK
ncbi:MAG TPA: hypothetical protein VHC48_05750 [Puia sp.]|jgi:hypothetical protein|nr:hypothetical protein [Puia sp.]